MAKKAKKKVASKDIIVPAKLTEAEQDLMWHMENGYRLETDLLGANPVLRHLKEDEAIRPLSANRGTIEALEKRGLIVSGKGRDPLTLAWRARNRTEK
jgi:hypothetical protein